MKPIELTDTAGPSRGCSSRRARRDGGMTILELLFVLVIIAIVAAIAIPIYVNLIQKARETAVIDFMSKMKSAEEMWRLQSSTDTYTGSFADLASVSGISGAHGTSSTVVNDYRLDLVAGADAGGLYWRVNSAPVDGSTGVRWFYVDQTGVIRYEKGAPASSSSPAI